MKRYLLFLFLILNSSFLIFSQDFYAIDTIQKIEISFSQPNWDYILDTAKQGSDSYTMAQWVKINGVQFDSAGVKYKGNSSYNPNNLKNPLHIELDHFISQDYLGYKDIKLSNGYHEPSFVREVMLYSIFQNYAEASRANFAQVYINGQYWGVYSNVEAVTNTFLDDRLFSNNGTFIFADNGGCDLRYKGNDSTMYYTPYTMKSTYGWAELMHLCDSLINNISGIENILDVDRTLWLHSYTNATVTLDSYLGNSKHNYYIYEDHNGRFNPIIWDLNGGLGVFNKLDFGPGLTTAQMQNLTPLAHANDSMWPLVKNLLAVPIYKRMYIAHMKTIMSENISNNYYYTFAQQLQSIVDTAVASDPKKFDTYANFLSNLNNTVIQGPKTIPGITELMIARNTFLNSTAEFQQVAPVISGITPSNSFPLINSNVFITATVSNATAVYLGMRYSVMERFTRIVMYDDGLHGDGTSGDGVYGVSVSVSQPEIQYYIYADNNNAGIFSPARAEHEYYTLDANYAALSAGQVVINEIMAVNNTTIQNANGVYGDWIELYNTTSNTVSMDYLNLSDNISNSTKWQFPNGKTISPNGFLIVWADNDTSSTEIHCDFGFSGNGEQAIISYSNGTILDSVSFPVQTADITWGRYPNGTGPFMFLTPTFNAVNSIAGVGEEMNENDISIYPNPCNSQFTVYGLRSMVELSVVDVLGNKLLSATVNKKQETVNLSVASGIYLLHIQNENYSLTRKIVVNH
ncbi:MAG: CotH kinase family protein [Bacteroidetes bacterium]|nr:CotH kinase family protein [Bacteroidota bacterium]